MTTYEIRTVQVVTQEQIDDVMSTALDSGISYWCDDVRIDGELPDNLYMSDMLTRGNVLKFHTREEDTWHELTIVKLLDEMGKMQFNFDEYDSMDADSLIQRSLFGEVIYG